MAKIVKLKPTSKGEPRWGVRWKDVKGNGRQRNFSSRHEAAEFRSQKEIEIPRKRRRVSRISVLEVPSFKQASEAYLSSLNHPKTGEDPKEPVTLRGYGSILKEHVYPRIGRKRVTSVAEDDYNVIYRGCDETGMSPRTRTEALRLMRCVLEYAHGQGHIEHVPVNPIKSRKTKAEVHAEKDAAERKYYSPDEIYTMLAAADSLAEDTNKQTRRVWARYRPMVYFLVYTGARISEARAFRRQDYASQEGRVHIRESAPEGKGSNRTKTTAGRRWVPMNPELSAILEPWMKAHNRTLVFGTSTDNPISLPTLYPRLLETLKDRADQLADSGSDPRFVKPRRDRQFHAFRHHYASWLVKEGANLKQLQTFMGHSSVAFTIDVYGHLFEDDGQELAARMTMKRGAA